jgi:hypothetical protein
VGWRAHRAEDGALSMKPVDQTSFGAYEGNCFSACVASILELDLDDVPFFMGEEDWSEALLKWCEDRRIAVDFSTQFPAPAGEICIVGGESPRHPTRWHAVIMRDGALVHDPHPDRTGIVGPPWNWIALRVTEAAQPKEDE